jgi:hypothetical protein
MLKRSLIAWSLMLIVVTSAHAEVTAWLNPGTAATVDRDSKVAWINPDNAKNGSSSNYASNTPGAGNYGDWLRLTNFDFASAIPAGATIDGIEVKKLRRASSSSREYHDSAVYLRQSTGQVGVNKALLGNWSTTAVTDIHGGPTDLWGAAWTRDDIASPDFGVDISVAANGDSYRAEIYYVQVCVYYTPASATTFKVAGVPNPERVAGITNPARVAGVVLGATLSPPAEGVELYFANTVATCPESEGTKTLEVRLSQASAAPVTCDWTAVGTNSYDGAQSSTYGSGADFAPASDTLTFEPGQTSKNITLTIVDGTAAEPDQRLNVTLSNPVGANIQTGAGTCELTIADNDRDCLMDVTNLPTSDPIGGGSGWGGSSWNLNKTGTDGDNNSIKLQACLISSRISIPALPSSFTSRWAPMSSIAMTTRWPRPSIRTKSPSLAPAITLWSIRREAIQCLFIRCPTPSPAACLTATKPGTYITNQSTPK